MSVELAKAFCARMMSDDEFRANIGSAVSASAISDLLKSEKYEFKKAELLKVIGELLGKKIQPEELTAMVCQVYEEEIKTAGKGSTEAVAAWLDGLA